MRITKIESQKKNPSRKNIYIDGEFALGISAETLLRFGLRTGDEIGSEKLTALAATEELSSARSVALRFLSHRARSEREVRDKLREKEFGDEEIAKTLDGLRSLGLLDDAAFARSYIRHQLAIRPKGKLALSRKLLQLGVQKDVIENALSDAFAETSQENAARAAAEKFLKKSSMSRIDPATRKQKLAAFLGRRGFTWDIISTVTKEITGEKADDE